MEILIVGAIIMFILVYNNTIDKDKFFADNQKYLEAFKEDDYQFLVYAKYGEDVDVDQLYSKRVTSAFIAFLVRIIIIDQHLLVNSTDNANKVSLLQEPDT